MPTNAPSQSHLPSFCTSMQATYAHISHAFVSTTLISLPDRRDNVPAFQTQERRLIPPMIPGHIAVLWIVLTRTRQYAGKRPCRCSRRAVIYVAVMAT
mmetsp:Transcript_38818/g.57021  ORF Transcript_38818/g.57021 Transcript_38818/m.57021 type:complete len:98 (-) Transcript_38818:88-381(-)